MKQLLVLLFFLCSATVSAQDVIVKKDGSTIICRIVNLTESEIIYKKWSDLNGSNYVMERSAASAINYQNGKKVNLSEATNLYMPNNQNDGVQQYNDKMLLEIDKTVNKLPLNAKAKRLKSIGFIGGGVLLGVGVLFLSSSGGNEWLLRNDGAKPIGWACVGGAIVWTSSFLVASHTVQQKQKVISTNLYHYNFNFNNNTSLSAGIDMLSDHIVINNTLGLGLQYNF